MDRRARTIPASLAAAVSLLALAGSSAAAAGSDAARTQSWLKPAIDKRHKPLYDGLWRRNVSPENKRWARRASSCESSRNPDALGADGVYRGAFQFSEGTWKNAPRSPGGDPIAYSYRTQAFVAVRLRTRDGDGHWPSCA